LPPPASDSSATSWAGSIIDMAKAPLGAHTLHAIDWSLQTATGLRIGREYRERRKSLAPGGTNSTHTDIARTGHRHGTDMDASTDSRTRRNRAAQKGTLATAGGRACGSMRTWTQEGDSWVALRRWFAVLLGHSRASAGDEMTCRKWRVGCRGARVAGEHKIPRALRRRCESFWA
jgi:hypothetical protein